MDPPIRQKIIAVSDPDLFPLCFISGVIHTLQPFSAIEHAIPDPCYGSRHGQFCQSPAILKGIFADLGQSRRKRNAFQGVAAVERTLRRTEQFFTSQDKASPVFFQIPYNTNRSPPLKVGLYYTKPENKCQIQKGNS